MSYAKKSYVEHVAIRVRDIHWHIRFFREALGMTIREVDGSTDEPKQVWTVGGMQLMADPDFKGPEGRLAHLGVMTDDLEAALRQRRPWASPSCRRDATGSRCPMGSRSKSSRRPPVRSLPHWRSIREPEGRSRDPRTLKRNES